MEFLKQLPTFLNLTYWFFLNLKCNYYFIGFMKHAIITHIPSIQFTCIYSHNKMLIFFKNRITMPTPLELQQYVIYEMD